MAVTKRERKGGVDAFNTRERNDAIRRQIWQRAAKQLRAYVYIPGAIPLEVSWKSSILSVFVLLCVVVVLGVVIELLIGQSKYACDVCLCMFRVRICADGCDWHFVVL